MSSKNSLTRPLLLLIPLIALGGGCNTLPKPPKLAEKVNESFVINDPTASDRGVEMLFGDQQNSVLSKQINDPIRHPSASLNAANQRNPQDAGVKEFLKSARQLELAGKFPESIRQFEWLLQNGNESVMVLHRLAVLYDKTGQYDRSMPLYQRAVELDPTNAELLCDIGFRSWIDGDMQKASKHFELALKYEPNLARAHNNMALVLTRLNKTDLALNHFIQAGCTNEQARQNILLIAEGEETPEPKRFSIAEALREAFSGFH